MKVVPAAFFLYTQHTLLRAGHKYYPAEPRGQPKDAPVYAQHKRDQPPIGWQTGTLPKRRSTKIAGNEYNVLLILNLAIHPRVRENRLLE